MKLSEIQNWKEVKDQFGIDKARAISKRLQKVIPKQEENNTVLVDCDPEKSEASCIFKMIEETETKRLYEYTGTIN